MRIVLGVSGGIAAYKSVALTSLLVKSGHEVRVVLTAHGAEFVRALPFETLTGYDVVQDMFTNQKDPVLHIDLAKWADVVIVAPATANIVAKMRCGIADDFLSTMLLACTVPVFVAPAMNTHMYEHPATQENIAVLRERGVQFIEPAEGLLACGDVGKGKMAEPEWIAELVVRHLRRSEVLAGKHVIISAGPTREAIDPVRYITNHSSGKMGYALAEMAYDFGAKVTLVSGPTHLTASPGITRIDVVSTQDMFDAVVNVYDSADAVIMAAAPADYKPATYSNQKIKKAADDLHMSFAKNPDILKWLGAHNTGQCLIGFAAESHDLLQHAKEKLARKQLDMIVVNDITAANAGFGHDVNTVQMIHADGGVEALPTMSKNDLAQAILMRLVQLFDKKESRQ